MTTYKAVSLRYNAMAPANRFQEMVRILSDEALSAYAAKEGYKGQIARAELARRA